jgi:hypothetical protein
MRKFLVMAVAATLSMGILGCGEDKPKDTGTKTSGTVVKPAGTDVKASDKPTDAPKGS